MRFSRALISVLGVGLALSLILLSFRHKVVLDHPIPVYSAVFTPDGTRIITVDKKMHFRVWEVDTCKLLSSGQDLRSNCAVISPDGKWAAGNDIRFGGQFPRLNPLTGTSTPPLLEQKQFIWSPMCFAFAPDSCRLVAGYYEGPVLVWNVVTGKITCDFKLPSSVYAVSFNPSGKEIATACGDTTAQVWDAKTGKPISPIFQHDDVVLSICFRADGNAVLTGSHDGKARIWDIKTGTLLCPPMTHLGSVRSAIFSPDGKSVLTASDDGTARLWDATTGVAITPPLTHGDSVNTAFFSPDGKKVITTSLDCTAKVWNAKTGALLFTLTDPIISHEDSKWYDYFVRTANYYRPGTVDYVIPDQILPPVMLDGCFSPDGSKILTANEDGTVRMWDADSGYPLYVW